MSVIIGLLKGGSIGAGLGFAFIYLGGLAQAGWMHYILYALIGLLVGLVAGKPFWVKRAENESKLVPIFRAVLGIGVSIGLYAIVVKAFGDPQLSFAASWPQVGASAGVTATVTTISRLPYVLGGLIGVAYGVFVEVDDGGKRKDKDKSE